MGRSGSPSIGTYSSISNGYHLVEAFTREAIAPWTGISITDLAHLEETDEIATVTLCLNQHEVPVDMPARLPTELTEPRIS